MKIDQYTGDLSTWAEAGRFFYILNRDRDNLPADVQTLVRSWTVQARNNREKIDILYRYLQANQRYVSIQLGIGGWQTFDAAFVNDKKYGDCKALSNYMKALLKAVNTTAYQALVFANAAGAPVIDAELAVPRFNRVRLLSPDGGKLVRTPALTPAANTERSLTDILLDELGNATVRQPGIRASRPLRGSAAVLPGGDESRRGAGGAGETGLSPVLHPLIMHHDGMRLLIIH